MPAIPPPPPRLCTPVFRIGSTLTPPTACNDEGRGQQLTKQRSGIRGKKGRYRYYWC
ncbi:hypothetical protein M422DRAFT_29504 [Sphaerobolus stellatus SS14]|uniref:Uncharacterized protein n=1 Tax=Sphaerobolus stellatus (strain SS14) TaxID=990650 RepID=A0A0C9USG5_SPHS4|nr:hypothetical protein M422DRAFT_29504 [Sphaerobolus stellatus SS14]